MAAIDDRTGHGASGGAFAGLPPVREVPVADVASAVRSSGRRLVVLDDDPTGTQTVAGVPVLTDWSVEDIRWALRQDTPAFYILTNTRSLDARAAGERDRDVVRALVDAARIEHQRFVVVSRSDSTLRGHFPLETDVIADTLALRAGIEVDGIVVAPAYIEGGRVTVDSVHWLRAGDTAVPVGESEFAKDATFGFVSSELRAYVEEKTFGRWRAAEVPRVTLEDLRTGGVDEVAAILASARGRRPVVCDALCDDDLRVLALAAIRVEHAGRVLLYRVGPSFVRARAGLEARASLTPAEVAAIRSAGQQPSARPLGGDAGGDGASLAEASSHGLVVVGSHVAQSTRQLAALLRHGGVEAIELDVATLLDPGQSPVAIASAADAVVAGLRSADVVVSTSREVLTGPDPTASLAIARAVSASLVDLVRKVTGRVRPGFVVAKGGITSSDVATAGLGIRRAWVRGTLLPGIVSLWEPVADATAGAAAHPPIPFVVFAGNVGDEDDLVSVVATLRGAP